MKTPFLQFLALVLGTALGTSSALAQFRKVSDVRLHQVALLENGNWLGTGSEGVYLSADGGVAWTKTAFPSSGRPGVGVAIGSLVGGGLTFVGALDDGIWLSRDHGTNWTFTGPVASSFGTGIGRMAFNGTDYVAGYSGWPRGLYRWNGSGWDKTRAGNDGISVIATKNGRFLAGLWGGGVVSSDDGGRTWRNNHLEFQYLVRAADAVLGVSQPSGVVRRSDDNGDTWREEGSAVPAASTGFVDQPVVYGGGLYVPVHGSGIWLRRPDLSWTRVLTNSGFCSVHVVGASLIVAAAEGVFQLADESALARILAQPQSITANLGDNTSLAVVAANANTVQWFKDGNPLPGATNATLSLTNIQSPRIGDYQVIVANGFGAVTSSVATLTINGVNPGIWKGLVGYYPFSGSGDDLSALGNHGVENRVSYGTDRFGRLAASLALSEVSRPNSMVVSNAVFRSGQRDFTIGVWVALTDAAEANEIGTIFNTFPHPGVAMLFGTPGKPGEMRFSVGTGQRWDSVEAFPGITGWGVNAWKHVVLTKAGSTLRQYADGHLVTEAIVNSQFAVDCSLIFGSATHRGLMGDAGYNFRGLLDDARVYNRALSDAEVRALHEYESFPPSSYPRIASATAQVVNGFVVGASITDGGSGYTNAPTVTISGGGGTGATAVATVSNGAVNKITITNPGIGYTSTPTITIAPPPFPPRRAVATTQVINGFVVGATVSDGGFGYQQPPAVLITGGGGVGARAVATVANGVVTGITITHPGAGYASAPAIRIASPPFSPSLSVEVSRVNVKLRVVLGRKYQIESTTDLVTWTPAGPAFVAEDEDLVQEFPVDAVGRLFRINQVP